MAQGTEEAEPLRHAAASDRRTAGAPTPEPSGNASGDVCAALASLLRGVLHIGPGSSGFKRPQYARVHADASSGLPGYDESGVLSRTVFAFVSALLLQGSKRQLSADDLFPPPAQFNAREAADAIEEPLLYELHHHGGEAKRRVPLTARALWRSFKFSFLRTAAFKLLNDVVGALPPLIMGALLAYLSNEPSESRVNVFNANSTAAGYALAVALFIVPITKTIIEQQYFYRAQLLNIAFKTGLTTLVYRKAVRLSVASKQGTTSGEVMNHMQLDAFKVGDLMTYFNVLWSGLVQIALYLGLINLYIGVSAFGGFGALLLIIPVQLWAFRLINRMRSKQMHHADLRVKQQNECLSGIKIIKLNAWEDPVGKQALDQRAEEVKWLRRVALVQGFITALMWTAPVIVALCAFTIYSIGLNGAMTASRVFPSLVLFNQLRFPVIFYPRVLNQIADALVALRRLGRFFSLDEADPNAPAKEQTLLQLRVGDEAVVCHDASFHFCKLEDEEDTRNKRVPFLQCVGITLRMGELSCVVGTVGSGKTSIALALLGELHQCSGSPVRVNGRVAYASQSAWIQNGTLRENILFGSPMNRDLYEKVLRATCLKDDVDSLQNGDQTEIGEKGVTLSGGQKQRVALARAAFADADIYVLDDPLSALDATVGKQVFNELICGLLNEKAVLLTTHALHLLDKADTVIVMESGSVVQQGSYEELMRHKKEGDTFARLAEEHGSISEDTEGGLFSTSMNSPRAPVDKRALRRSRSSGTILSFVKKDRNRGGNTNASSTDEDDDTAAATTSNAGSESGSEDSRENRLYEDASMTHNEKSGLQKDTKEASDGAQAAKGKASSGGLVKEEHREEGTVQLGVYLEYLRAYPGGFVMATIVFIIVIMRQVGSVGQMYWLSVWSEQTTGEQKDQTEWGSMQYLTVYGLMAAGVGVVTYCSSISFWLCGLTAARKLHLNLFSSILAARMRFFDETPHGRVLQRFQKDTDVLDNQVPQTLSTVAQFFCQLACILLIMSYAQPLLFPFFFPVGALYYYVQRFFRASYREVKRLESVLASPVYAHFSETLDGLATVRAFGRQEEFKRENMNRVLENQRAFYAQRCCCDRWLPVRLETIGNSFVLLTGVLGVMLHDSNVDALKTYTSLVGLLLTYSLEMTSLLNWLVRYVCIIFYAFTSLRTKICEIAG